MNDDVNVVLVDNVTDIDASSTELNLADSWIHIEISMAPAHAATRE